MTREGHRWHAPELNGHQASIAALAFVAAVAIADLLMGASAVLLPLVVIGPFLVAAYGTPGQTIAVGVITLCVAAALGAADEFFGSADHITALVAIVLGGIAAAWLADRRLRRENLLAHERPAAELGRRLELALAAGRMGTWSWDLATGRVEWDDACSTLFGMAPADFVGTFESWAGTLHPDDRELVLEQVHAAVEGRSRFRFDHRCVWPDDSVHWLEGSGEALIGDDGEVLGATGVVLDIDARRRAEESIWAAGTRAAALLELTQALTVAGDTAAVTDVILRRALPAVGARGGLTIVDRHARLVRHVGIDGYPDDELDHWQTMPLEARTPITDAARDGRPRYVESAEHLVGEYPHLDRVRAATGDEAFAALPLEGPDGEAIGVLMVAYARPRTFSTEDRTFLETLASVCGQSLGRAQGTELEHGLRLLSALDSLLDAVAIDSAVRDENGRIVDFRIDYVNAARAAAARQVADQLTGRSLLEVAPDMKGSELFDSYVQVVETGEPLRLDAVPYDQLVGGRSDTGTYELQASKFGDGLIVAARDVTRRDSALAALRDSQARLAEAQRIAHLGSWEWDATTGEITWSDEMYRIYGLDLGSEVRTLDEAIDFCVPESREDVRRTLKESMREGGSFSYEQSIVRGDGEIRTTMVHAEPYHDGGTLIALRGTTQDVTEQRAAQEALFYASTELEREQQVVEALQRAILPHELPEVDGIELSAHYLPASTDVEIGGDWYDAFVLSDGRVCLSVGDVAGHGVQSAATMGQLRNAFRAYAFAGYGPAQTLVQLDHLLNAADESDWSCATCLFVEYTPETRRLRWARAGHPHPLLQDGTVRELVGAGGPPIGAGVPDYDQTEVTIGPGAMVFFYTDGLIEVPGEVLDVGIARVVRAIDELEHDDDFNLFATRICTEVLADRPRRDDVCVLAMRVAD